MEWEVSPQEYRYILGDFVRSGISIKYEKVCIESEGVLSGKTIFFPHISGRQYQVYTDWHCVSSERDSLDYHILGEIEAGKLVDYDIECFKRWNYFRDAFKVNVEDESILHDCTANCLYAFVHDYKVRFFPVPIKSYDDIEGDIIRKNIQKMHIFEIFDNYKNQEHIGQKRLYYPIHMSLDWFYLIDGKKLEIETVIRSISSNNDISQDDLMVNYVIDSFPSMSETEIIEVFQTVRDNYAGKNKTKRNEWYVHTAALMDGILKDDRAKNIGRKVKIVRSFCNNQGVVSLQLSENNIPYIKHVLKEYKKKVEAMYDILMEEGYISEETVLSDFKYYLTGKQTSDIKGVIHWMKGTVELVGFISCICNEDYKVEWSAVSEIFYNDSKGETFKPDSLKTSKSREPKKQIDIFKRLFE